MRTTLLKYNLNLSGPWAAIHALAAVIVAAAVPSPLDGQRPPPTQRDSVRGDSVPRIRLGDIVVSASTDEAAIPSYTHKRVGLVDIKRQDAAAVADFARLIPAAHVQTNSRGETLVYLRNAGERQVAVFFDGALLNIPWDNRVDLSLIPAAVVGEIAVAKGVPPVEYGVNVLGGAVSLLPREPAGPWSETELLAQYGTQDRQQLSLTHRAWRGRWMITGSFSHSVVDGLPVPDDADLPFSQADGELRTNTDSRITNAFGSASYELGDGSRIGLALIHVDARKGIAPEGHLDPSTSRVRYWRYPDWRNSMAIVNGQGLLGNALVKGAAWITSFGQTIESFGSDTYETIDATQVDEDLTLGARFTMAGELGPGTAKFAFNGLTSRHRQRDVAYEGGAPAPGEIFPRMAYRQHTVSAGVEYTFVPHERWSVTLGTSLDAMLTPETGDKPQRDPFVDYSLTGGVSRGLGDRWFVRGAVGRKTRFPTMRELFGEALNRFLINPDLSPESSILVEFALGVTGEKLSGEIVPFGTFTTGTIDQRNVLIPGETSTRRQRVNLAGSRVLGVELVAATMPANDFSVHAHLTLMDVVRHQDDPTDPTVLSERPAALGRISGEYHPRSGFTAQVEAVYTGNAYSLNDQGDFLRLDDAVVLNTRLSQEIHVTPSQTLEVFVRANNLTDTVRLPQLGLPEAGRTFSGGASFLF